MLVGAGDIADSGSGDSATAALLDGIPGTVFTTGDNVYPNGTASRVQQLLPTDLGRLKARTRPSPGNHDYNTSGATGYYNYFGSQAGPSGQGYYSYDLGDWHIVSLNSNISMSAGSRAGAVAAQDLAANTQAVHAGVLAPPAVHLGRQPRAVHLHRARCTRRSTTTTRTWSSGATTTSTSGSPRRTPTAGWTRRAASARSSRAWAAPAHYGFGTIKPNSEARNSDTCGVLKLTLHSNSYDWQFVPEAGKTLHRQRHHRLPLTRIGAGGRRCICPLSTNHGRRAGKG